MYIKEAYIEQDIGIRFPKFHTQKCQTIQSFIDSGRFSQRYTFSNSAYCNLIDKNSGNHYKNIRLELCNNCRKISQQQFSTIQTTQDFNEFFKKFTKEVDVKLDIFGYLYNWHKLSKAYRESKQYTCEKCGLKPKNIKDRGFWQVDHIDDDKLNNQKENLQCLCIRCHSEKDMRHQENFSRDPMQKQLAYFNSIYIASEI